MVHGVHLNSLSIIVMLTSIVERPSDIVIFVGPEANTKLPSPYSNLFTEQLMNLVKVTARAPMYSSSSGKVSTHTAWR